MKATLSISALILFLFQTYILEAQKSIEIVKLTEPIIIDGIYEPEKWEASVPARDFIQMQPHSGSPASSATEVYIGQDENTIYICAILYFEKELVASVQNRDNLTESDDGFLLILDSYNDNRSAYAFLINPLGTQVDFRINDDGRNIDVNWDTEWKSAVRVEEKRWIVEIALPFSSIRYIKNASTWGINFGRLIRSNFEKDYWSGTLSDDFRISQGGKLTGLIAPERRSKLSLFPYATLRYENNEVNGQNNQLSQDIGADFKWQINPNATFDGTINPDFATVEADQERVNLSRYELNYPEKRLFFQEGNEMYDTRIKTFYSRRIQDILYGAKINAKAGKYNFNAMNVRTLQRENLELQPSYYSTFRMKRDFLESSSLGFTAVDNRNDQGSVSTFSGDYMLNLGKKWKLTGQLVASLPGDFTSHSAWFVRFANESNIHHVHFRYTELGENFQENVNVSGFITDDNRREIDSDLSYRFWLNNNWLRYIYLETRNNIFWSRTNGDLRSWYITEGILFYFANRISLEYSYNNEYKLFDKSYFNHFHSYSLGYNTEEWSHVSSNFSFGDNFDRKYYRIRGEASAKLTDKMALKYEADYIKFSPDTSNSSTFINVLNLHYNFTKDFWIEIFTQTRSNTDKFYLYGKMGWRFKPPFGALYLIYSHDQDWLLATRMDTDAVFIKLTLPLSIIK